MFKLVLSLTILSYAWLFYDNSSARGVNNLRLKNTEFKSDTLTKAIFPDVNGTGQYIVKNFIVPEEVFKIKGKNQEIVIGGNVEIEISPEGKATFLKLLNYKIEPKNSKVIKAVNYEFTRLCEAMPLWTPALRNGKPILSKQNIPLILSGFAHMTYGEYIRYKEKEKIIPPKQKVERKTKDGNIVYSFLKKPPIYPGGDKALRSYLKDNLKYVQRSSINSTGKIKTLGIIVNKEGVAEEIVLLYPEDDPEFNYIEAQAILKNMFKWNPGKQGVIFVSSLYTIPFVFK